MDNINNNLAATTTTTSFYGKSVSLFQYPTQLNKSDKQEQFQIRGRNEETVLEFPETFTNIHSTAYMSKNIFSPIVDGPTKLETDLTYLQLAYKLELLEKVSGTERPIANST